MRPLPTGIPRTLAANRWRYASLIGGVLLFVAPFALFSRAVFAATGNQAVATLHTICFRMPIDWLLSGRFFMLWGSVAAAFILGVVVLSYFAGPVFCGWLCPVGAASEGLSRAIPLPRWLRLRIPSSGVAAGMRWGFLAGFAAVSVLVASKAFGGAFGGICCRFCPASVLQNGVSAAAGDAGALAYWHSGSLLALGGWLLIGGVFLAGGRGWCLVLCPLGAVSSLAHRLGARHGWLATRHEPEHCAGCATCGVSCPVFAIRADRTVDQDLCMNCYECTHACASASYRCSTRVRGVTRGLPAPSDAAAGGAG